MESISLGEFLKLRDSGINILDSRPTSLFSKKHIPDSIGISINGSFEHMINCFFPEKSKLILISKRDRLSESVLRLESEGFLDIIYFDINFWINGGMDSFKIPRVEASKASKYVDNLDEFRHLFLNPEVDDFKPVWNSPDGQELENFLCNNYRFNRDRVMKTIEIYTNSKSKARQYTLGDF